MRHKKYSVSILIQAAKYEQYDLVKLLLENEADVNAEDQDGTTPLHLSIFWQFK